MNPLIGTILGDRYTLTGRIAAGGMAEVWSATDAVLGRMVAVKLLSPALSQSSTFLERFRAEARCCAALDRPNITTVFDYGEDDGSAYLVMELVAGQPLSQLISDRAPLSAQTTAAILIQAAHALEAAHRSGVVHRDVKPANILITAEGTAKLTDFGISRLVDTAPLTQTGVVLGTVQYLSPEQAMGQAATASSDIYALGVVGHEMLTGQVPFDTGTAVGTALAHINQQPPALPGTVPVGIREVIQAALAKNPSDRPPTAAAMARALGMPDVTYSSAAGSAAPQVPVTRITEISIAEALPARTRAMPSQAPQAQAPQEQTLQAQTRVLPGQAVLARPGLAAADLPDRRHRLRPAWLFGAAAAVALIGVAAFALPGGNDNQTPAVTHTSSTSSQGDPAQSTSTTAETTGTTTTIASPSAASSMPRQHARVKDPARGHQDKKDGKP